METVRSLAGGLFPGYRAEVHTVPDGKSDPLFDPLEAGIARQDPKLGVAAVTGRIGPKLDALIDSHRPAFDALTRVLNGRDRAANSIFEEPTSLTAGRSGVTMSGPLRLASTLSENLLLEYTNGMSGGHLGWGRLNASNLQQIIALHTAYADLMRRTPYLARARGSNLLSHVLRSLEQAVSAKPVKGAIGAPETVLAVISGHDTNISNLSGMPHLSWVLPSHQPDDAPPDGALIFSLWKSTSIGRYFGSITVCRADPRSDARGNSARRLESSSVRQPVCAGLQHAHRGLRL
jgi:4-phytase / acid phosphatase